MSNERIDFSELEDLQESWEERLTEEGIKEALGHWLFENGNELIAELKRCYEELDSLPTRWQMSEIHNYTKWLETVESYFLADGSFNQDTDFVRKCAVNEQYGYRIEVIDGVETVVHESEYPASE